MVTRALLVPMMALFAGCAASAMTQEPGDDRLSRVVDAPPGIRFYQASVFQAVLTGPQEHRPPRPYEVETLSGGITIDSCADVIDALAAPPERELLYGFDPQEIHHLETCVTNGLSARARPAERSYFSRESPLRDIVQRLNLLDVSAILKPAHPERKELRWFEIGQTEVWDRAEFTFEPTEISVETEDWWFGIELVASADWTGDGLEDVLVVFTDDAKLGSLLSHRPIVLEAPSAKGPLRVREGFELLRELLRAEQLG